MVDLPPGPDGRRTQKWTSGYATKREAQLALARLVVDRAPTWRTVEQYLREDWLPASAAWVRPSICAVTGSCSRRTSCRSSATTASTTSTR